MADAHAHRFRDKFSVDLLSVVVPIEGVSVLMEHQSVRIAEKHYVGESAAGAVRTTYVAHGLLRNRQKGYIWGL